MAHPETPILALGRRAAAAVQRMRDHDIDGKDYDPKRSDCSCRINGSACDEYFSLSRTACDLPAETITDALVQLEAAAGLVEILVTTDIDDPAASQLDADYRRIERAITSAIRVLLEVPGAIVEGLDRDEFTTSVRNRWGNGLPPVRIGGGD